MRAKLEKGIAEKATVVQELQYARQAAERALKDLQTLEDKHVELTRENKVLEAAAGALKKVGERDRKSLEDELARLSRPGAPVRAPERPLDGKVTAVSPEIGLVVISIGREGGVLAGDGFTIYRSIDGKGPVLFTDGFTISRSGEFVAKIVIDRVDAKWSAGRVTLKKSDPRVGDDVSNAIFAAHAAVSVPAPVAPKSADDIKQIRRELDEIRKQVRALSDRLLPSWTGQGVAVDTIPEELGAHLGVSKGLLVRRVREGSPAAKAGLQAWDVVPNLTEAELLDAIDRGAAIRIIRGGKER